MSQPSNQNITSATSAAAEQARKIFGTDGVRAIPNINPVTAETALKLGRAAAHVFSQSTSHGRRRGGRPTIVIGKDTRQSGYMLENALAAGDDVAGRGRAPHRSASQPRGCLHHPLPARGRR